MGNLDGTLSAWQKFLSKFTWKNVCLVGAIFSILMAGFCFGAGITMMLLAVKIVYVPFAFIAMVMWMIPVAIFVIGYLSTDK